MVLPEGNFQVRCRPDCAGFAMVRAMEDFLRAGGMPDGVVVGLTGHVDCVGLEDGVAVEAGFLHGGSFHDAEG
jgi:hypothetical protein